MQHLHKLCPVIKIHLQEMDALKICKTIVFCFSFAMFCLQFRISIEKLLIPPLIDVSEEVSIDTIDMPIITVCPTNRINLTKFQENGYNKNDLMLFGNARYHGVSYMSWGAHLNKTFSQLTDALFPNILASNDVNPKLYPPGSRLIEQVYVPKYGYCMTISNYSQGYKLSITVIQADHDIHIFITDPKRHSTPILWFESQHGELITGTKGVEAWYDVQIRQKLKSNPNIKGVCEEYDSMTFADCVDEKVSEVMMPVLGCNPPYLSAKNQCTGYFVDEDLSKVRNYFKDINFWNEYLMELLAMRPIPPQKMCKEPCIATESYIELRGTNTPDHPRNGATMTKVNLNFKQTVLKAYKIINYSPYDFLIDSGSSLGLWLGLSIFSLTDLSFTALYFIKKRIVYIVK